MVLVLSLRQNAVNNHVNVGLCGACMLFLSVSARDREITGEEAEGVSTARETEVEPLLTCTNLEEVSCWGVSTIPA